MGGNNTPASGKPKSFSWSEIGDVPIKKADDSPPVSKNAVKESIPELERRYSRESNAPSASFPSLPKPSASFPSLPKPSASFPSLPKPSAQSHPASGSFVTLGIAAAILILFCGSALFIFDISGQGWLSGASAPQGVPPQDISAQKIPPASGGQAPIRNSSAPGMPASSTSPAAPPPMLSDVPNSLMLGVGAPSDANLTISPPSELDFLSREEVFAIRKTAVNSYSALANGTYSPFSGVYGQIEDGAPWWGMSGIFCNGSGPESIDGASEEARELQNPFLLLYPDEPNAYRNPSERCFPFDLKSVSLSWNAENSSAVAVFDRSRYVREKANAMSKSIPWVENGLVFRMNNNNARDWGYNFVYAEKMPGEPYASRPSGTLTSQVVQLYGFIHLGDSCGFEKGCNNGSPDQPELDLKITTKTKGVAFKLWKSAPESPDSPADFTYIILFV